MSTVYGGLEAGGTKFVCAVGSCPEDLQDEIRYETTAPDETIHRAIEYFRAQNVKYPLGAIGIGSFGPADVRRDSQGYGFITVTPKKGWSNTDFAGAVARGLGVPVRFDTDVNAAALGEGRWGAAQGLRDFIYLTVGTGIGGGGMANGRLMHGLLHPEMGHLRIPHDREKDAYPGRCPFHGDCLEGLASGPAMTDRWGIPAERLPAEHEAWKLEARYIALALVNYICVLSPQRIIIGGGVMENRQLYRLVRGQVLELLNGYAPSPDVEENMEEYIVPPGLGNRAGILGAIALAGTASGGD